MDFTGTTTLRTFNLIKISYSNKLEKLKLCSSKSQTKKLSNANIQG